MLQKSATFTNQIYNCKLNYYVSFYLAESPSDDLDSSFPNEKGLLVAVKEEIPQPSKQTALSTCTTGMSQTELDDSGFFAPQNEESQDNDNVDIVKMTFKVGILWKYFLLIFFIKSTMCHKYNCMIYFVFRKKRI